MSVPIVSVTICAHNSRRYIDETLQSILAQTCQDFEINIVDDGSSDGTADYIEREYRDPRIRIARQRNQTLKVARPMATAMATGELIAFLDHDDVWLPDKLEKQIAIARAQPRAALIFSDCFLIDATGRVTGRLSDQFDFDRLELGGIRAHLELLRRGCFVSYSTALVRASAFRAVGGFNHSYQYVSDYDLWLRLARRYELRCVLEPLAKYRIHSTQFTQSRSDVTLAEHVALLLPVMRSASYPRDVRIAVRDNLFGQHRVVCAALWQRHRFRAALAAILGTYRYPTPIGGYLRGRLATSAAGPPLRRGLQLYRRARKVGGRGACWVANECRRAVVRGRRARARIGRIVRGREPLIRTLRAVAPPAASAASPATVWIDGSPLGREETGYFNLLSELIRRLARSRYDVHVTTTRAGREALCDRLGHEASTLQFHALGWRAAHWSEIHRLVFGWHAQILLTVLGAVLLTIGVEREWPIVWQLAALLVTFTAASSIDELVAQLREIRQRPGRRLTQRAVRFLWRRWPAPRRPGAARNVVEILVWRGRFRWRRSHRIAIVQDLTTRVHPELHTPGNVAEFDEFLGYVQHHAHAIATVSEHSRRDIIDRIGVSPDSVSVLPMPVHPQYAAPCVDVRFVRCHGINGPYVVCLGTIEPRKNLRRLIRAFEFLSEESVAQEVTLVLAGGGGWDGEFARFLSETDGSGRVRTLGFVPLEHLPSLYRFAEAVIYPSLYEGFGLPVLEAMCCSSVVLASRVSSLPEVLGSDGILFDPFDTRDIAAALLRALAMTPPEAAAYRRRCYERAKAHLERVAASDPLPANPSAVTPAWA